MIELKLSQGAKPGHGGVLPGPKVTLEIAEARGVQPWVDCVSPASHGAFTTPIEMMHFIDAAARALGRQADRLQALHRPPLGVVRHRQGDAGDRHHARLHRRRRRRGRHRRGAARVHRPRRRAAAGRPAAGAQHAGRRSTCASKIKLGCAGKVVSAFDIARMLALGADWCNAARGFMFALGCIQAQTCHTGACPTGVTTQDPQRQKALDVPSKADRVLPLPPEHADGAEGAGAGGGPRRPGAASPPITSSGATPSTASSCSPTCCRSSRPASCSTTSSTHAGVPHLLADGQRRAASARDAGAAAPARRRGGGRRARRRRLSGRRPRCR